MTAPTEEQLPDDIAERPAGVGGFDRLRLLLAVAMGTVLVSYAVLVPATAAVLLTAGGGMSLDGAFGAAVPLWLAAHHIPLVIDGEPLSVLPLLPTAGVLLVVATGASWAVQRLSGRPRSDAGAVVAAIAGAHAAVAVLGSALLPATAAVAVAPWSAMLGGGLVGGVGAGIGVLRRCGLPPEWAERVPGWLREGLIAAGVAVVGLVGVGAAVLTVGVVLRADAVTASFAALAPDGGAGIGVALLTLAYVPNAAIGALAWVLGPGVTVGTATATPFLVAPGEPPGFPLLAVLPDSGPAPWTGLVLLVPVAIGVLTGMRCHRATPAERLPATLTATVLAALSAAALAELSGGRLAAGPYDPIQLSPGLVGASVLLLVGIPASLVYLFRIGSGERGAAAEGADDLSGDADDADPSGADDRADGAGARREDGAADDRAGAAEADDDPTGGDPTGDDPTDHDLGGHDPAGHDSAGDSTGGDSTGGDRTGEDLAGSGRTAGGRAGGDRAAGGRTDGDRTGGEVDDRTDRDQAGDDLTDHNQAGGERSGADLAQDERVGDERADGDQARGDGIDRRRRAGGRGERARADRERAGRGPTADGSGDDLPENEPVGGDRAGEDDDAEAGEHAPGRAPSGRGDRVAGGRNSAVERARLRRARRAGSGAVRTPQEERAERILRRERSAASAAETAEPPAVPDVAEPEPEAVAEPPRPRTVGELVALRAQEAAEKAAAEDGEV